MRRNIFLNTCFCLIYGNDAAVMKIPSPHSNYHHEKPSAGEYSLIPTHIIVVIIQSIHIPTSCKCPPPMSSEVQRWFSNFCLVQVHIMDWSIQWTSSGARVCRVHKKLAVICEFMLHWLDLENIACPPMVSEWRAFKRRVEKLEFVPATSRGFAGLRGLWTKTVAPNQY